MKESDNDYHISFFKPTTERAMFNRNLVVWLASIWFVAIFGFHILLKVIEKPTPEPAHELFRSSWTQLKSRNYAEKDLQHLGQASLSVLGKVAIEADERQILSDAMTWSIIQLYPEASRASISSEIEDFANLKSGITDINDSQYVIKKAELSKKFSPVLGLSALDARTKILPIELSNPNELIPVETASVRLPEIMDKYLIHYQSVLTDTIFLGFPFHYFYSAVFLLILFVGLCWLYCIRSDRRNAILGIEE